MDLVLDIRVAPDYIDMIFARPANNNLGMYALHLEGDEANLFRRWLSRRDDIDDTALIPYDPLTDRQHP
jgi:hypothetical protein